ncbi:MAG: hypothetical protein IT384_23435 [Deltaproteobacteria bacterium]|nr:hypothetical protein [Deltaproteobacteria bacterium]
MRRDLPRAELQRVAVGLERGELDRAEAIERFVRLVVRERLGTLSRAPGLIAAVSAMVEADAQLSSRLVSFLSRPLEP